MEKMMIVRHSAHTTLAAATAATAVIPLLFLGGAGTASAGTTTIASTLSSALAAGPMRTDDPQQKLMDMLPKGFDSSNCHTARVNGKELAHVACGANQSDSGPTGANFYLYPDIDTMNADYQGSFTAGKVPVVNCPDGSSEGRYQLPNQSTDAGSRFCELYKNSDGAEYPNIVYTSDAKLALGYVSTPSAGNNAQLLYDWWKGSGQFK